MDGWWSEIDQEICECVARHGSVAPADLARQLGLSESALASLLSLLVQQGRLRITRIELSPSAPMPAGRCTGRPHKEGGDDAEGRSVTLSVQQGP